MRPFTYTRASDPQQATRLGPHAAFIAGGTTMTDLMKLNVLQPGGLVDVNPLAAASYGTIEATASGLRLGALVRMAEAEQHPVILRDYPLIAESLMQAASPQIRNMASLGGNILQRTRCNYFRETSWHCNKRVPGSGCAAMDGVNRQHAVLGTSPHCIATYPGDFAQALIALDTAVETQGPAGTRRIAFSDLHRLPDDTPHIETSLLPGELITFLHVPAGAWTRRSRYLKVRDRDSYAFALASAAVALDLESGRVREARIALGGLATVPWRARAAEQSLQGQEINEANAATAAETAFASAQSYGGNAFKIALGKRTLIRALLETSQMGA
jgi:xanthine dehydrogenase YagS FAD-binding subunit